MRLFIVSTSTSMIREVERSLADPASDIEICGHGTPDAETKPDAILLSDTAPAAICAALKRQCPDVPVIIIGADGAVPTPPAGFDGAPCLTMPFGADDVRALLQGGADDGLCGKSTRLHQAGPIAMDPRTKAVWVDGRVLDLTAKEYDVLAILVDNPGTTLTKEMFLDRLYDPGHEPAMKIIDVFVCKIRRKIKALTGGNPLIDTVWGRGYVLKAAQNTGVTSGPPAVSTVIGT